MKIKLIQGEVITRYQQASPFGYNGSLVTILNSRRGAPLREHSRTLASYEYTDDANGMRTSRSNGSTTYTYVYNGSQLTQMTKGSDTLYFTYGALGPTTVTWNGTTYYYALNAQGDVIGIFDDGGNGVVLYNWDNAWGYHPQPEGPMADTLGTLNPLRYRSYVYDEETGLYYLQSRYYNPEIGRFINADALVSTGQGLLGNNMFAYCLNNPIMFADSTGTRAQVWQVIFEDHDPGYIHRAVQAHIILKNSIIDKELVLPGIGRADIYNPKTYEMWEIKHGGSTSEMKNERRLSADNQVSKYIQGAKEKLGLTYYKGHAGAFNGEFILTCDSVSYLISYDTPANGVILYYVKQLKKQESNVFAAYPSKEYGYAKKVSIFALGVGGSALVACMFGMGSSNRGLQLGLTR